MEEKYWALREAVDRAYDNFHKECSGESHAAYLAAKQNLEDFCVTVLEMLMDENSDILARLK